MHCHGLNYSSLIINFVWLRNLVATLYFIIASWFLFLVEFFSHWGVECKRCLTLQLPLHPQTRQYLLFHAVKQGLDLQFRWKSCSTLGYWADWWSQHLNAHDVHRGVIIHFCLNKRKQQKSGSFCKSYSE